MRLNLLAIFLTAAVLAGCASPQPFTMTCSSIGAATVEPGERIDLEGFSVTAPRDRRWCLAFKGPRQVVFGTHPLMGQYIETPEARMAENTVVMVAQRVRHGAASLADADEFQQFVEAWIGRGFGVNTSGSEFIVADAVDPRFTVLRSSVRPEPFLNADCVRYVLESEERSNPRVPTKVLIINARGQVCNHPKDPDYLVAMQFSERYPRGEQIDPRLFGSLERQHAEPFFKSLVFPTAE